MGDVSEIMGGALTEWKQNMRLENRIMAMMMNNCYCKIKNIKKLHVSENRNGVLG